MNSDNDLDHLQHSVAYSEGDTSEDLVETEMKLKEDIEDFRDLLPPPIPLMSKTFRPSEPIFQCQEMPFLIVPSVQPNEKLEEIGPITDKANFPERFSADTTFRNLFSSAKLVYLRNSFLIGDNFNHNTCNLKKLFLARRLREKKDERNYYNPLLYNELDNYYKLEPLEKTLLFESRFESGNLAMASKVSDNEYNLLLQSDVNSKGHTQ